MIKDKHKEQAAQSALQYLRERLAGGMRPVIGVGTGSTANIFATGLAGLGLHAAVASSNETERVLRRVGVDCISLEESGVLPLYVDGADEVDVGANLIKGGGGALTREKLIAAASSEFCCIVDETKRVQTLGNYPLPIEVIPIAEGWIAGKLRDMGATEVQRRVGLTDNGNPILDVQGLDFSDPLALEETIESWVGVVCCGVFAKNRPHRIVVAGEGGVNVETIG